VEFVRLSLVAKDVAEDWLNRHDLTDEEWVRLAPLLPVGGRQVRPRADHRTVVNGVFHRVRAGQPWRDLPSVYGPWKTVYNRHRRWSGDGMWEAILEALQTGCDQDEGPDWGPTAATAPRSTPSSRRSATSTG
jgi:transposase